MFLVGLQNIVKQIKYREVLVFCPGSHFFVNIVELLSKVVCVYIYLCPGYSDFMCVYICVTHLAVHVFAFVLKLEKEWKPKYNKSLPEM